MRVRALGVDLPGHGRHALAGVDLTMAPGEHVALLGPSGSGKTTLLRALLGAVPRSTGSVALGGRDPASSRAEVRVLRRSTGLVRQGGDLVPSLSVRANALAGVSSELGVRGWCALLRGRAPEVLADRLRTLAEVQGLGDMLDVPVEHLSGGQRQRAALVRALLGRPGLVLADEPTSGLDPGTAATAVAALRGVPVTLLVATHDLAVARSFPRVVALRAGSVVHDGPGFDADAAESLYGVRA